MQSGAEYNTSKSIQLDVIISVVWQKERVCVCVHVYYDSSGENETQINRKGEMTVRVKTVGTGEW